MKPRSDKEQYLIPGEGRWQIWEEDSEAGRMEYVGDVTDTEQFTRIVDIYAIPVRDLTCVPLLADSEVDAEISRTVSEHLERLGLPSNSGRFAWWRSGRDVVTVVSHSPSGNEARNAKEYWPSTHFVCADENCESEIIVWRELGRLTVGFFRHAQCVYSGVLGTVSLDEHVCSELMSISVSLVESGFISLPLKLTFRGIKPEDAREWLGIPALVEEVVVYSRSRKPENYRLVPPEIAYGRNVARRRKKILFNLATVVFIIITSFVSISLFLHRERRELRELEEVRDSLQSQAGVSVSSAERWEALRDGLHPPLFAVERFSEIASEVTGDEVKLDSFRVEEGGRSRYQLTAEDQERALAFKKQLERLAGEWSVVVGEALPGEPTSIMAASEAAGGSR